VYPDFHPWGIHPRRQNHFSITFQNFHTFTSNFTSNFDNLEKCLNMLILGWPFVYPDFHPRETQPKRQNHFSSFFRIFIFSHQISHQILKISNIAYTHPC
jgi:hypothetical protein